jgi:hypothetical protein
VPQQRSAKGYVTMTTTTAPTSVEYLGTELGWKVRQILTRCISVTNSLTAAASRLANRLA